MLFIECRYLFTIVNLYKVYGWGFFVNFCIIKKSIYWIDISFVRESWIFFSFCWSYISQSLHFLYFVDLYFNLLVLLLFIFTSIDIYNIQCFVDLFKNLYFLSLAISNNEEPCYMYLSIVHAGLNVSCQKFFLSIFTKSWCSYKKTHMNITAVSIKWYFVTSVLLSQRGVKYSESYICLDFQ